MMKNILTVLMLSICTLVSAQKVENFVVNPTKSLVKWSGKKIVGGETQGTILVESGTLSFSDKKLKAGNVVMDTKSIHSEKASTRLLAHLKDPDFFDVEKFPKASFVITEVKQQAGNVLVKGKITIKGITKELSFTAVPTYGKDIVVTKAIDVKFDRTQFGIQYNSGSVIAGLGDKAIEDNIALDITLIAEKK